MCWWLFLHLYKVIVVLQIRLVNLSSSFLLFLIIFFPLFSSTGGWVTMSNITAVVEPNKRSLVVVCHGLNMQLTENVVSTHTVNILCKLMNENNNFLISWLRVTSTYRLDETKFWLTFGVGKKIFFHPFGLNIFSECYIYIIMYKFVKRLNRYHSLSIIFNCI